ncbi:MAG: acyl--CoA ligase, partial [Acidobacteria bacterium]|nr:acyl--CoA ligase [Acidobacteriota bacterium]
VARSLPGGQRLDVDSFERRILGAERRLVRIGREPGGARAIAPEAGDLVLLSARNLDSWLVALAALWKRGFVPLLADADLSRPEISEVVGVFRPAFCILDRRADPEGGSFESLGESLAGLHACVPAQRAGGAPASARPKAPQDAAIVRLTSGTTGKPRGIVVTAGQLLSDARNICGTMRLRPEDTMVAAIPLGHAYGFVHLFMSLVLQGTRLLLLEQPLPAMLVEALSGAGPLVMPGTPYLFDLLLQAGGRRRFKGLRLCLSAGAPLPERLSRAFEDRFGLPIRTFYGASECGGICFDRSRDGVVPDGCVGTPLDGVRVTLRPSPGLDEGTGRICVESEAVALGYLPADPRGALQPGRFLTSDLGRQEEGGRLRITGRLDRMINVGGRKVDPVEVEAVLRDLPAVRQAVVFGAPDRQRGQAVCALLVAARGLTREAVLTACGARLARFKVPRRVEFVEKIPLSARGKTDRRALASLLTSRAPSRSAPPPAGPPRSPRPTIQRS